MAECYGISGRIAWNTQVEGILRLNKNTKEEQWSKSVAVGSEAFIMNTMEKLGIKAKGREAVETDGRYQLREPVISYKPNFTPENIDLRPENTYFRNDIV